MKQSRLRDRKLGVKKIAKKKHRSYGKIFIIFGLLFLAILLIIYILLPKTWNGRDKIAIVFQKETEDSSIVILDPSSSSITSIDIPGDTELDASNQLGTWKVKSLKKLGDDEKLGGNLLKNTLIKSFKFPIDYWADENFVDLTSGNLVKKISGLFKINYTNLSFVDKLRIGLFSLGVSNSQKYNISLTNSSYLKKAQLKDGSLGYVVEGDIPSKIEVYFTLQDIPNLNLLINNNSQSSSTGEMISRGVQVLGLKVASIEKGEVKDYDCKISGENKIVYKLGKIFNCSVENNKPLNNFDIEISIGAKFKDRF